MPDLRLYNKMSIDREAEPLLNRLDHKKMESHRVWSQTDRLLIKEKSSTQDKWCAFIIQAFLCSAEENCFTVMKLLIIKLDCLAA